MLVDTQELIFTQQETRRLLKLTNIPEHHAYFQVHILFQGLDKIYMIYELFFTLRWAAPLCWGC